MLYLQERGQAVSRGFWVGSLDLLSKADLEFDYIVIASITKSVAMAMKSFLLSVGVAKEKITWVTDEFRGKKADAAG